MQENTLHPASDSALCEAIASGGDGRIRAIETIYNWTELKEKVMNYVHRHGGNRTEGLDIFHDGIVALDRNIRQGKFRGESPLQGYLYSICRFLWNNEWRKRAKVQSTEIQDFQQEPDMNTPEVLVRSREEAELLQHVLELLDESCKQILTLWKQSFSMTEIAEHMQLSSPELAKKYRYRCMQKLMHALEGQPQLLNALRHV